MSKTKIIYSPRCLEYEDSGHPESPERVKAAAAYLKKQGYKFIEPKPASETDLLLVHDQGLVERIKTGQFFESDTPNIPGIYEHALLSVGAAIMACELALKVELAFSLMRPPGHHAGPHKLGGFCYFNNLAIAVQKLLNQGMRVAIIDIDVHHGNGTQDIMLGKSNVMYLSLHRGWIYPNTGYESEDNCYNYPLDETARPEEYLKILTQGLENVKKFQSDIIAVSAGFDTFKSDRLISLGLNFDTYSKIGKLIGAFKLPVFATLEGGYHSKIGECVEAFVKGVGA